MKPIQVAVAAPVRALYTYCAPDDLPVVVGQLVEVPFGKSEKRAVVCSVDCDAPADVKLKDLLRIVDPVPVFNQALLKMIRWAADYYLVPPGEMMFAALPPVFRKCGRPIGPKKELRVVALPGFEDELDSLKNKAPRQAEVLALLQQKGTLAIRELEQQIKGARGTLRSLENKKLVEVRQSECARRPELFKLEEGSQEIELTDEQRQALARITKGLDHTGGNFLLHGVTGSGKTEVYLRAIEHARAQNRGAILLVPEISLTPQLSGRVISRFGDRVAVLHSGLSLGERLDEWRRLRDGQATVAVGARSAIFAPIARLGLVVVDEEHDPSYKQSERLPYNGRDLAFVRAREEGAAVVLGSATPSVESLYRATRGQYQLLRLTRRVSQRPLPSIEVVDLRKVIDPIERVQTLSEPLAQALAQTLDRSEQAILFLNRRGYSSFALCQQCGQAVQCENCSVALVHHLSQNQLNCHYCGSTRTFPLVCSKCQGGRVSLFGLGTEKIETEIERRFPGVRVLRLDSDSVHSRGYLQEVLHTFARREADVLVGTQMVTKGHDIPGVTLVGVILADLGLVLPDFRAAERTFQLMVQVAGRAGRGEVAGRVVLQSFLPGHQSIVLAQKEAVQEFYERELERRQALGYPPFRRLLLARFSHLDQNVVSDLAHAAANFVRQLAIDDLILLGPVASPLARLRKRYRFQFLLKAKRIEQLHYVAKYLQHNLATPAGARILFDVDPVDML